ncbi:glycosyltransferase family 25 protein [Pigmentiphaga soli]|uniref:Glycosyltransferase family 25 protein n=1 Tax=Pigmentiphaga soli TaxID=1007095 RepID=A0ABP8H6P8_9BURK
MHVYVISLADAAARRGDIVRQLEAAGLPFTIFDAVDGRALGADELARCYDGDAARRQYRDMSRGEIGCALSHLGVYRRLLEEGRPWALVLEDDAQLGERLPAVLRALEDALDAGRPDVTLLTHVDKYTRHGARRLDQTHRLVRRYGDWWLAHGYVVTRAAAQRMLEALRPVRTAADSWARFERQGIVALRAVVPYCIGLSPRAADSTLQEHRAEFMREARERRGWRYYLYMYGYRRFVHQIVVRPFLRVARQKKAP